MVPLKSYGAVYGETVAMQEAFPEALKKSILQEAVQGKLVPQDQMCIRDSFNAIDFPIF